MQSMSGEAKLSHTAAMVLQSVGLGHIYGYSIMEATGLPSGTVYPALRRLEMDELIVSRWERQNLAQNTQRPPRKYYKVTRVGNTVLEAARKRYPLLAKLTPAEVEQV
jgi:PadR family transcriptional regulator, regulatory protein PadR